MIQDRIKTCPGVKFATQAELDLDLGITEGVWVCWETVGLKFYVMEEDADKQSQRVLVIFDLARVARFDQMCLTQ